jgi:ankyrin repeat protein
LNNPFFSNLVEELIANGADVNAITAFGTSALSIAATRGYNVLLNLLISYGADIEVKEKFSGITPLITAIDDPAYSGSTRTDFENVVKTLIKKGADVNHV